MIGPLIVFLVPLAIAVALYSVLAVWAALGDGPWQLRGAIVFAALAVLVPIRGFAVLAIYLAAVPLIVAGSLLVQRFVEFSRSELDLPVSSRPNIRFHLRDVFLLIAVAAALAAMWRGQELEMRWHDVLALAGCVSAVVLVAQFGVQGRRLGRPLWCLGFLAVVLASDSILTNVASQWLDIYPIAFLWCTFAVFVATIAGLDVLFLALLLSSDLVAQRESATPVAHQVRCRNALLACGMIALGPVVGIGIHNLVQMIRLTS